MPLASFIPSPNMWYTVGFALCLVVALKLLRWVEIANVCRKLEEHGFVTRCSPPWELRNGVFALADRLIRNMPRPRFKLGSPKPRLSGRHIIWFAMRQDCLVAEFLWTGPKSWAGGIEVTPLRAIEVAALSDFDAGGA